MGNSTKEKRENKTMNLDAIKETGEEETAVKNKKIFGNVSGCTSLNVRAEANVESEIVSYLRVDAEVVIDEEGSTEDFYKVCTAAAVEGYCMKQYITLQK